jgi:hypothetical protein
MLAPPAKIEYNKVSQFKKGIEKPLGDSGKMNAGRNIQKGVETQWLKPRIAQI